MVKLLLSARTNTLRVGKKNSCITLFYTNRRICIWVPRPTSRISLPSSTSTIVDAFTRPESTTDSPRASWFDRNANGGRVLQPFPLNETACPDFAERNMLLDVTLLRFKSSLLYTYERAMWVRMCTEGAVIVAPTVNKGEKSRHVLIYGCTRCQ